MFELHKYLTPNGDLLDYLEFEQHLRQFPLDVSMSFHYRVLSTGDDLERELLPGSDYWVQAQTQYLEVEQLDFESLVSLAKQKFYQNMEQIAKLPNLHLNLSAGVDSMLVAGWLLKHGVPFTAIYWQVPGIGDTSWRHVPDTVRVVHQYLRTRGVDHIVQRVKPNWVEKFLYEPEHIYNSFPVFCMGNCYEQLGTDSKNIVICELGDIALMHDDEWLAANYMSNFPKTGEYVRDPVDVLQVKNSKVPFNRLQHYIVHLNTITKPHLNFVSPYLDHELMSYFRQGMKDWSPEVFKFQLDALLPRLIAAELGMLDFLDLARRDKYTIREFNLNGVTDIKRQVEFCKHQINQPTASRHLKHELIKNLMSLERGCITYEYASYLSAWNYVNALQSK